MTQFQHTLKALLEGRKTETSRIVKPGDYTFMCGERPAPWPARGIVPLYSDVWGERQTPDDPQRRLIHWIKWQQDKDYAIQPARGVHSVGRYRVEAIWRQDVRDLTEAQRKAEGFKSMTEFWTIWCQMHDARFQLTGGKWWTDLIHRPAERYQAWRMTIKVLWDTVDFDAPAVRTLQIDRSDLK